MHNRKRAKCHRAYVHYFFFSLQRDEGEEETKLGEYVAEGDELLIMQCFATTNSWLYKARKGGD